MLERRMWLRSGLKKETMIGLWSRLEGFEAFLCSRGPWKAAVNEGSENATLYLRSERRRFLVTRTLRERFVDALDSDLFLNRLLSCDITARSVELERLSGIAAIWSSIPGVTSGVVLPTSLLTLKRNLGVLTT